MTIRILLADDEPSVLSALRLRLEQETDVRVAGEVTNSDSLLKWLSVKSADILLLDWRLPGKPAMELIPLLHYNSPRLQVIVLDSGPQTRRDAIAAGADNFVSKVEPSEPLLAVLESTRRILNSSELNQGKSGHVYHGRDLNFSDFTRISVGAAIKVGVNYSPSYHVTVNNDEYERVHIEKDGEVLNVSRKGIDWLFPFRSHPEIQISMPDLYGLVLAGASQCRAGGFLINHSLFIEVTGASRLDLNNITAAETCLKVSGAGHITGNLQADDIEIDVSGASWAALSGSGKAMHLEIRGASHAGLEKFHVESVRAKIYGASHGSINTRGRLDADVHGASHLFWVGHPVMGDIAISGASHVQRR